MADRSRDTQRVARTAVKPGRNPPAAARSSSGRNDRAAVARRTETERAPRTVPGRKREVIALVMFGVAVFLFFVIVAGAKGGFVGRAAQTGLRVAVGRLALLVPVAFLCFSVTTVLEFKVRRAPWFAGVVVFLFGLFVLMAAGFSPFGGHDTANFVRSSFEARSGGLGEAIYALLHRLVGGVGVGIVGWLTLFAGAGLITGMTLRRMGSGGKKTVLAVKAGAENATMRMRSRDIDAFGPARVAPGGFDDLRTAPFGPRLGPVDLVGEREGAEEGDSAAAMG